MFTINQSNQFGESANELVNKWQGGYRYGFPDFLAYEPPVSPMHYDKGRMYTGVFGKQYEDSQNRYHYSYDPNLYLQPGISGTFSEAEPETIRKVVFLVGAGLLGLFVLGGILISRAGAERDDWDAILEEDDR